MTDPRHLGQRFVHLAGINILSNLTVPLVGLVDTAMLGHLSEIRFLAGVALGTLLFDYVYWSFGFLRMGTTGTTAQALGRNDRVEEYSVLYRSMLLALALAAVTLCAQWPLRELGFALLSGEPSVEQAGRDYFDARIWGAPATLCNFALVGWFLGRAQSRYVLVVTVVANLANIALNYVFIVRLQLAAYGAGLATMLSQYLMLAVSLGLLRAERGRVAWDWSRVLDLGRLGALLRLNRDILIRTLCLVTSFALFTNFSSIFGTKILAANTILLRLLSVAAYWIDGSAFAAETLAGFLFGRGDRAGLRRLFLLSIATGLAFAALMLGGLWIAPRGVLGLLTSHREVIGLAAASLPWLTPTLLFGAPAYMLDGLFLGLTRGPTIRNAMLFCTFCVFLPVAWWAVRTGNNAWLWLALVLFMAARTATLGWAARDLLRTDAA